LCHGSRPSIDHVETNAMAKEIVVDLIVMFLVTNPKEVVSVEPIVTKACALLVEVPIINSKIYLDLDQYP